MSILVYTENRDGKFRKPVFELLSYASGLSEMMGCKVTAISVGAVADEELSKLASFGADKILTVRGDAYNTFDTRVYTSLLADAAKATDASVVLMANNTSGKALAPRISVRLRAGIASGVTGLPDSTDPFSIHRRVYSGSALAKVVIKTPVRVLTLMQNSYDLKERNVSPVIEAFMPQNTPADKRTTVIEAQKQDGKVLLTEASVVVSGGRGMKSPDNWAPLVELAELLGGATACSRPVSDEGWRPHEEHTGQTGKIIAPDLYIAVGISGATQHLAGVSSSKYIVAINSDKSAPIFEAAQYGIVGDATRVLPKLVEAVRNTKQSNQ